ncbi:MAG: formate dehydrogenase accessory sulfurtransferase FdhD [Oscillochloridaceae bacterium]|nr:formate dehydrogenase accessory sulfurtransferase FdhD [Chloroflexaceae bacterium]MDW8390959.1 formate dehydrogenase accessory sulfurtransferase FdhD [Oscillochloridaceae bacterium]
MIAAWAEHDLSYLEIGDGAVAPGRKPIIRETSCALYVNGQRWVSLLCTPADLDTLALGFLRTEGLIESLDDVVELSVRYHGETSVAIWLKRSDLTLPRRPPLPSACVGGLTFAQRVHASYRLPAGPRLTPAQIYDQMARMLAHTADLYHDMGGFHVAALGDGQTLLLSAYDVGRHNAVDRLAGLSLVRGVPTTGRVLLVTGRVSTEMLHKAARLGIPLVASRNSPTESAVRLARAWGVTLCGYVRGRRMHLYSAPERLGFDPSAVQAAS